MLTPPLGAGADVNFEYTMFGDAAQRFTVLDHASDETVKAFLRSRGARCSTSPVVVRDAALRKVLRD